MNEMPSSEDLLQFDTANEVLKIIALILGWYITLFRGVLVQVTETKPVIRTVIGILLMMLMAVSIPDRRLKRHNISQNIVYWLTTIILILTMIFAIIIFGASMEEMGYSMSG